MPYDDRLLPSPPPVDDLQRVDAKTAYGKDQHPNIESSGMTSRPRGSDSTASPQSRSRQNGSHASADFAFESEDAMATVVRQLLDVHRGQSHRDREGIMWWDFAAVKRAPGLRHDSRSV